MKTSKSGKHQSEITISAYAPDQRLCLVTVVKEYLDRTKALRHHTKLFISFVKANQHVSKESISKWLKLGHVAAGVNISVFTPHSRKAALTSSAQPATISIATILKTAGWAKQYTFAKYCNKPINRDSVFCCQHSSIDCTLSPLHIYRQCPTLGVDALHVLCLCPCLIWVW